MKFLLFIVWLCFLIPIIVKSIRSLNGSEVTRKDWKISIGFAFLGSFLACFLLWGNSIFTESLWFKTVGFSARFWKVIYWRWMLFFGTLILSWLIFSINLRIFEKFTRKPFTEVDAEGKAYINEHVERDLKTTYTVLKFVGVFFALALAFISRYFWQVILLWINQVPAGTVDPLFGKDISFFLFSIPFQNVVSQIIMYSLMILIATFTIAYIYIAYGQNLPVSKKDSCGPVEKAGSRHMGILLIVWLAVTCIWRIILGKYCLVFSERGIVVGAGYTDVHVQMIIYTIIICLTMGVIVGILVFIASQKRSFTKLGFGFLALIIVLMALNYVPSMFVQFFRVSPNELVLEEPYIVRNIKGTNTAFNLHEIEYQEFPYVDEIDEKLLDENPKTIKNIRLWDWRALKLTINQLQAIRLYYEFFDIDIDRYYIDGEYKQIMLSLRELNKEKLLSKSKTFVNLKIIYTHAFGVTATPVSEFMEGGLPNLIIKDMPPKTKYQELEIEQPRAYYSELSDDYIVVKATEKEFDYPKGDGNMYTTYEGEGGIELSSYLRKFSFALRCGGFPFLLSRYITTESRIMLYRNIMERTKRIAPFLIFDRDPYIVIENGKIYWLMDAYTTSQNFPYSERYSDDKALKDFNRINYIRNSVKVVIDSYNGNVSLYIFDENDPIIRTYQRIFPGLFKSKSEMPDLIRKHIRYPEDYFTVQARMLKDYHMHDPKVFYNKEDAWEIAEEKYYEYSQQVEPYYVIIKLPGQDSEEFVLMLPFTPKAKNNMIAWMCARCDEENYGKLLLYKFSKEMLIYGPNQVEARIDQETEMSKNFTLWGQAGSSVIRGNLLVIPIGNSILYVEPVYLKAETGEMPQIKRVIVALGSQAVVWGKTLEEALNNLYSGKIIKASDLLEEGVEITPKKLIEAAIEKINELENIIKLINDSL